MKRLLMPALAIAAFALAVSGCQSVPKPESIPLDATVIDLSQRGQEAIDNSNYKAAEVYYQLIIDRYGESNISALTSAEFEIAHLRLKKKHWSDAKARLEKIIARYETAGGTSLPPEYLVLAKNDLARIPAGVVKQLDAQDNVPVTKAADTAAPAAVTAPAAPAADDTTSPAQ